MTNWKSETHATTTIARSETGAIQHIKCRAEYFEVKETGDGIEDEYCEGVHAKIKFDVVDGDTAVLDGVKDISDDAPNGYETSLKFIRSMPIAEDAVSNVPGINHVESIEAEILDEMDRGATARQ